MFNKSKSIVWKSISPNFFIPAINSSKKDIVKSAYINGNGMSLILCNTIQVFYCSMFFVNIARTIFYRNCIFSLLQWTIRLCSLIRVFHKSQPKESLQNIVKGRAWLWLYFAFRCLSGKLEPNSSPEISLRNKGLYISNTYQTSVTKI